MEAIEPGRARRLKASRLHRRVYKANGPNHMWHVDGNDKLKPFGFCLSGCIDGFSRKLMWLNVARTNKDPHLICTNYVEAVSELNVIPRIVRMDRGTENVHLATVQRLLRAEHTDSLSSVAVMYGSSTHNQRIERFWSYLRQILLEQYITLFKTYVEEAVIDTSNPLHMECLAFCFMGVLRSDLKEVLNSWNNHKIRSMKLSACPSGVPNILFEEPSLFGFDQQGKEFNHELINQCAELHEIEIPDCDYTFEEWALEKMIAANKCFPTNFAEAMSLFSYLIIEVFKLSA